MLKTDARPSTLLHAWVASLNAPMGSTLQANNGQTGLCLPLHSYSRSASHAPQTFPLVDPSVPGSLFLSFIMSARFLIYCSSRYRWKSLPNIHCSLLRGILRLKVTLLNLCPSSWLFFFFFPLQGVNFMPCYSWPYCKVKLIVNWHSVLISFLKISLSTHTHCHRETQADRLSSQAGTVSVSLNILCSLLNDLWNFFVPCCSLLPLRGNRKGLPYLHHSSLNK